MLFPRLRFQTKLMLAVIAVIGLVVLAVLAATGRKVRATYSATSQAQIKEQVDRITEMRRLRLEGSEKFLDRLAQMPEVEAAFRDGDFRQSDLQKIQKAVNETVSVRGAGGGMANFLGGGNRAIFLVGLDGSLHPLSGMTRGTRESKKKAIREFSEVNDFDSAQYGYLIFENASGKASPLEVAIKPVYLADEAGRKTISGALLTGQLLDAQGRAGGLGAGGKQKGPRLGRSPVPSGLLVEGTLFTDVTKDATELEEINQALERLTAAPDSEVAVSLSGENFRVFLGDLTSPGASLPPAYQVIFYPLSSLEQDLKDLRLLGGGVAIAAMMFGSLLSWLLSRNIARPILELVGGTQAVKRGDFEARVHPRGGDEIGELANSFNEMTEGLQMREQLRDVLGKVTDTAVAQALIEGNLELGGESREVSILFCDIRGFTSLTESMPPDQVIEVVNAHMTAMTEVVYRHKGVVDKFVGDEIMAVFGAPKSYGDDAENAIACAREMLARRRELNVANELPLEIGVGIATGEVIVGCMGSVDRLNYTVLGERVNRAARLCSLAARGEAIVDDTTVIRASDESCEKLPPVRPKGYSTDIQVYRVQEAVPTEPRGQLAEVS